MFHNLLVQLGSLAYVVHGLLSGKLLAFLLGIAESRASLYALDAHPAAECGAVGPYGVFR